MRRRQIWGQGQVTIPSVQAPGIEVNVLGKGICKHCKKFIGRGIYFHEKYCK